MVLYIYIYILFICMLHVFIYIFICYIFYDTYIIKLIVCVCTAIGRKGMEDT